ncbi:MAG: hypothetical protein C0599_05710 [Salinivirgaceae bacterium]|nr:MAG: hypothetical protein C0599_05710 [Salinivirgaceae bacterium]
MSIAYTLMKDKFRNKYRIQSNRLFGWDYSGKGAYFITLVTQNRECILGQIIKRNRKTLTKLSPFGLIVKSEWLKSFDIRDELILDEYIIMPNHLHGIVKLETNRSLVKNDNENKKNIENLFENALEPHGRASLQSNFNGRASVRANDYDTQIQNQQSLFAHPNLFRHLLQGLNHL